MILYLVVLLFEEECGSVCPSSKYSKVCLPNLESCSAVHTGCDVDRGHGPRGTYVNAPSLFLAATASTKYRFRFLFLGGREHLSTLCIICLPIYGCLYSSVYTESCSVVFRVRDLFRTIFLFRCLVSCMIDLSDEFIIAGRFLSLSCICFEFLAISNFLVSLFRPCNK